MEEFNLQMRISHKLQKINFDLRRYLEQGKNASFVKNNFKRIKGTSLRSIPQYFGTFNNEDSLK